MKISRLLAVIAMAASSAVAAQDYPSNAVRIIVPFPAGQSTDVLARVIAQDLTTSLGQSFYVENRGGGAAIPGTTTAAQSDADGYTLVTASNGNFGINPSLHPSLTYSPTDDFRGIAKFGTFPQVLAVPASSPYQSADELLNAITKNPGKINFASAGNGTTQHLTMELLRSDLKFNVLHVPYKGSAAALVDLMAGRTDVMFDSMPSVLPHIQSGKVRALGVSTLKRSPLLPDVPTLDESIAAGFEVNTWVGIAAPADTPDNVIAKLNESINASLRKPEVGKQLARLAITPASETPEEFSSFIKAETEKWRKAVEDSGAVSQ